MITLKAGYYRMTVVYICIYIALILLINVQSRVCVDIDKNNKKLISFEYVEEKYKNSFYTWQCYGKHEFEYFSFFSFFFFFCQTLMNKILENKQLIKMKWKRIRAILVMSLGFERISAFVVFDNKENK